LNKDLLQLENKLQLLDHNPTLALEVEVEDQMDTLLDIMLALHNHLLVTMR
jgi:hypothetical protein